MATHHAVHAQASQAVLGTGLASAALPAMLAAWDADSVRYGEHFATHASGHREAAVSYLKTDGDGAGAIDGAGSAL
ncbi:hypothetical protein AWB94_13900 [Mycolicibacterium canariasense]|nr:hypothetical protein AWB94_13900 [Mycolicibacterium canariasense]